MAWGVITVRTVHVHGGACETIGVSNANTAKSRPDASNSVVAVVDCPKYSIDEVDAILREYKRVGLLYKDIDEKTVEGIRRSQMEIRASCKPSR